MIKACEKCHGSGWVRTTALHVVNRPDHCGECGGTGLAHHPFHPADTPGKCSYCAYPVVSWAHMDKNERAARDAELIAQREGKKRAEVDG